MKDIKEYLKESLSSFGTYRDYRYDEIDEGVVGDFFKKTFNYLKSKISKIGNWFVAVYNDKILPAITPLTAQSFHKKLNLDKQGIHWMGTAEDARITGVSTNPEDVLNFYERDSRKAWARELREMKEERGDISLLIEAFTLAHEKKIIRTVDTPRLRRLIRGSIRTRNEKGDRPLFIWGAPGVGKTAIISNVLSEGYNKKWRVISLQCAAMTRDSFTLPAFEEVKGKKTPVDLPKKVFPVYRVDPDMTAEEIKAADEATGGGILFLDELSRCSQEVLDVLLQITGERKLGDDYVLGSNWTIIAAGNRESDGVRMNATAMAAINNRFRQYNYSPTIKTWRQWAENRKYINKHILDWLEQNEKYFYYSDDPDDPSIIATPRMWEAACVTLAEFANTANGEGYRLEDIPDDLISLALDGCVGTEVSDLFMEYVKLIRTIDIEDLKKVLTVGDKAPIPKKEGKTFRTDLMYIISTQILSLLPEGKLPDSKTFENVCKWFIKIGDESLFGNFWNMFNNKYIDLSPSLHCGIESAYTESSILKAGFDLACKAFPDLVDVDNPFG
jgi:hypothetical protein